DALHVRVVIKEGKKYSNPLDDRCPEFRFNPCPILIEPPVDCFELLPFLFILNESSGGLPVFAFPDVLNPMAFQISQQFLRTSRTHPFGLLVQNKAVAIKRRMFFESVDLNREVFAFETAIALFDFLLQEFGIDRTFVHIKERHIVEKNLVEENDELDEV